MIFKVPLTQAILRHILGFFKMLLVSLYLSFRLGFHCTDDLYQCFQPENLRHKKGGFWECQFRAVEMEYHH